MENLLASANMILSGTPARWKALLDSTPDDLLRRRPADGEWSAIECLLHLMDLEDQVFSARTQAFLDGSDFKAFDPDTMGEKLAGQSAEELLQRFAEKRNTSLQLFSTLTTEDLARKAIHSELGEVTLGEMIHEWVGHDVMHTVQAEQAILQPLIEGCGPWHVYFEKHKA